MTDIAQLKQELSLAHDANASLEQSLLDKNAELAALIWQPIETAPKTDDLTMLLLLINHCVFMGFYNNRTGHWDDGDFYDDLGKPTHWMPLPSPPIDAALEKHHV